MWRWVGDIVVSRTQENVLDSDFESRNILHKFLLLPLLHSHRRQTPYISPER